MKFFSKKFLTDEHIKLLKNSRKIYAKDKIVDLGGNFVEVLNYEKRIKVLPDQDEILDLLDQVERFDPHWNCVLNASWDEYRNYRYEDLPPKLKSYMSKMDDYYFSVWVNGVLKRESLDRYNRLESKLERMKENFTDEDFINHVLLGRSIPSALGKKAKDSARRSFKVVNDLIRTNIHRFTTFMTFTFALEENKQKYEEKNNQRLPGEYDIKFNYADGSDFESSKNALKGVMDSIRKTLKKQGKEFYYITVWELQQNGNYHFHVLSSDLPEEETYKIPKWLDYNFHKKEFNNGSGIKLWKYGKSDIQKIHSPDRIGSYVSKYIIKSFLNVTEESYLDYLNKKKYFPSRNLDQATTIYFDTDKKFDEEFKRLELEGIDPFKKSYKNVYNDSVIEKKIYTKIKKEVSEKSNTP